MADILNPTVPGVSVSPYPPELQLEAQKIARRRALVDMLMMQGMRPPQSPTGYGGQPVPMSPFAAAVPLVSAALAARGMGKTDEAASALTQRYSAGLADARAQMFDKIRAGDYAGANQIAGQWPALSKISEELALRTLPKPELTRTYGPQGEQPSIVDLNAPSAPPQPVGAPKPPTLHPVETANETGQPQTSFVDLAPPGGVVPPPMPKPVKLVGENLGGTTDLINPYGPERTLPHTIDPNRVPTNEDIEAAAKRIEEYRAPGYATAGGRAAPWQMQVMRRVDELAAAKGKVYDSSVFPVVKAAEVEFNQKNAPIVRSFGTLVGHVAAAKELFAALDNPTDIKRLNQARNFFQDEFGYPAPGNVDVAKQFIADESVKAVLGGPGALDDRKAMAAKLSRASSSAQFNTDADTVIHFGVENMKNHLQQLKGMTKGKRAEEDFIQYLSPNAREAFFKYGGSDRRKGPQEGVAVPPTPSGGIALPSTSAIDAELARRAAGGR